MQSAVWPAAVLSLLSLAVFAALRYHQHHSMVDMLVYRAEGAAVVHGQDLYAMRLPGWNLAATYPPFAALLFAPSAWVPAATLRIIVMFLNIGLLAVAVHLSVKLAGWSGRRYHAAAVLLGTGFGVWLEPVFTTLQYGQVNLAVLGLVLWDMTRSDSRTPKGVGIGLATAIKITPGLFVVYLLLTRQVRAAAVSIGTFLAAALIGWVALPGASGSFWTRYLWDTRRVGEVQLVDNQSLRGVAARLLHTDHPGSAVMVVAALVGLLGLAVAVAAGRSAAALPRAEAWGAVATAVAALLISPISWTHHFVWCVPLLVLLAAEARTWPARCLLAAVSVAFLSYAMWLAPNQDGRGLPWSWQLPSAPYAPVLIAVLIHLGLRTRQARRLPPVAAEADLILQRAELESIH
ncbi:glycosyltransferase 87 family protein [Kitasatospora sp. RB6PN24]|uniref:glycosyltransferase 87 family protein n=1 Tax=Kitasatospora humi TaxID=2893891 RepID=UPI001E3B3D63|nr:glycosyltransferase 87 family protein [Kitasatospora humi]MCC9308700.1 glycosyltransferase 87 family protein [Kitasatospora humi]